LDGLAKEDVGICQGHYIYVFYGRMVYFMAIWYILRSFGIFFPVLVRFAEKNLATLLHYMEKF
jgi:hypothetical protein